MGEKSPLLLNSEGWPFSKLNRIFQELSRLSFILPQDDQILCLINAAP